jgi:hypothetical protein
MYKSPSFFDDRISRQSSLEELDNQLIEENSTKLKQKIDLQGPYNVYRAVNEVQEFLKVVDKEYHLTSDQREHLEQTRLTFDKIFKYK